MKPRLSILICSIPSRFEKVKALYEHIMSLVGDKNIEVLVFMDNKKRTIGEKREALKNISNGNYFMFVDDDDTIYSIEEVYEACHDVDVVTFKNKSLNNDGSSFIVTMNLGNPVEHNNNGNGQYIDLKRPPFPCCAWNERFKSVTYPVTNYGEDAVWVKYALLIAQTETHIDKVIHGYNYDPNVSEAVIIDKPRRCIVNLVTHNPPYIKGQQRLVHSLQRSGVDVITFIGEESVGAPKHSENPYAFKIYAIEEARNRGYDQILWLDASVYAVGDVSKVFEWIDTHGIFLEEAGHYAGTWSPQYVLDYFKITKEQAMQMPMFAAGYCGFDFRTFTSREFFRRWKEAMLAGMFKGNWQESRHDMSAGSIIAKQMGYEYSTGGNFFAYIGEAYGTPKETVVFHLKGVA